MYTAKMEQYLIAQADCDEKSALVSLMKLVFGSPTVSNVMPTVPSITTTNQPPLAKTTTTLPAPRVEPKSSPKKKDSRDENWKLSTVEDSETPVGIRGKRINPWTPSPKVFGGEGEFTPTPEMLAAAKAMDEDEMEVKFSLSHSGANCILVPELPADFENSGFIAAYPATKQVNNMEVLARQCLWGLHPVGRCALCNVTATHCFTDGKKQISPKMYKDLIAAHMWIESRAYARGVRWNTFLDRLREIPNSPFKKNAVLKLSGVAVALKEVTDIFQSGPSSR
jgi:hypothetical protein